MADRINIVVVLKSGGDFVMSDVYLLTAHINKYWLNKVTKPNIYCFTDLVEKPRSVLGLDIMPLPHPEWPGWWSKMNLFSPELESLRPFLYMDLDTAIIGQLDFIAPPIDLQNSFVALRDFYHPTKMASGVMWIPNNAAMQHVFVVWSKKPVYYMKKFRGDQNFIAACANADYYWQDVFGTEYITTFKPNQQIRTEKPLKSSVVCFHGQPRIPKAAESVEWVKQYYNYAI